MSLKNLTSSLLLCALAMSATGAIGQGTKPQAQPTPLQLADRVRKTLKAAILDLDEEKARLQMEVVGEHSGWIITQGHDVHNPQFSVMDDSSAKWVEGQEKQVQDSLTDINLKVQAWRDKKMSDFDLIRALYEAAIYSCRLAYWAHHPDGDFRVINCAASLKIAQAEDASLRTGAQAAAATINAACKAVWDEDLAKLSVINQRLDHERKKWGSEIWTYIDFAKAKTAKPSDGHGWVEAYGLQLLNQAFTMPPKPMQVPKILNLGSGVPNGMFLPGKAAMAADPAASNTFALAPWAKSISDPALQVFADAPGMLSVGFALEPTVDKLRGYKEEEDVWSISDAIAIQGIDLMTDSPYVGRIVPRRVEDSDTFTVFVYGHKLPVKPGDLKSLQSADKNVRYKPLAFLSDIKSEGFDPALKRAWNMGQGTVASMLTGPTAQNFQDMPAMLLQVQCAPGVMAGRKSFKINGAEGGWFLDSGTTEATLDFAVEMNDDPKGVRVGELHTAATKKAFLGQRIVIEAQTKSPVPLDEIDLVVGRGESWLEFDGQSIVKAKKVDPTQIPNAPGGSYRAVIQIVEDGDVRLVPGEASREPGTLYLDASAGDLLFATFADPQQFKMKKSTAVLAVLPDPSASLWANALEKAAKASGDNRLENLKTLPAQVEEAVENSAISNIFEMHDNPNRNVPLSVTTKIRIGDHAAALLLRDHFVQMMKEIADQLASVNTDQKKIAFIQAWNPHKGGEDSSILLDMVVQGSRDEIRNINGTPMPTGKKVLDTMPLRYWLQKNLAPGDQGVYVTAFDQYAKSVNDSLNNANDIPDKDIHALLDLTGHGFEQVEADLKPLLMKPLKEGEGYRWVTDYVAIAHVGGVKVLYDDLKAQKAVEDTEKSVAIALAALTPLGLEAGLARTLLQLSLNAYLLVEFSAQTIPKYAGEDAEIAFARGAVEVLGTGRYYLADLQKTPGWARALNWIGMGVVGASTVNEVYTAMSLLSKSTAMQFAVKVAKEIKNGGLAAFSKATPTEKAAFIATESATELAAQMPRFKTQVLRGSDINKALKNIRAQIHDPKVPAAATELYPEEQQIQAAFKQLVAEAKPLTKGKTPLLPEAELPADLPSESQTPTLLHPEPPTRPQGFVPSADAYPEALPLPEKPGPWIAPNNLPFQLEAPLSRGQASTFFDVWKVAGKKLVLKVFKMVDWLPKMEMPVDFIGPRQLVERIGEEASYNAGLTFDGVAKASDTLRDFGIEHLPINDMFKCGNRGYVVQEFLPVEEGQIVEKIIGRGGELKGPAAEPVYSFMEEMVKKKIAFEDFKMDNVYVRKVTESVNKFTGLPEARKGADVCGVIDVDRIAAWGDFDEGMDLMTSELENNPQGHGIRSVVGPANGFYSVGSLRKINSVEEFWILTLEKKGLIEFVPGHGFISYRLDINRLKRFLPGLDRTEIIDFTKVRPTQPQYVPPPTGPQRLEVLRTISMNVLQLAAA